MSDKDVMISKRAVLEQLKGCLTGGETEYEYVKLHIDSIPPATPDVLADMLMEERIRGELKQNMSYSREVIDNVRCKLTVDIIDRRPCFCGAELREVWREEENNDR